MRFFYFGTAVLLACAHCQAWNVASPSSLNALAVGSSTTVLSSQGAELAVAKSIVRPTLLKGTLGETVAQGVVGKILLTQGKWQSLTPRLAPQGIDHLFVKFDSNMQPRSLLIGETKYGTSKLGITLTGQQMSRPWCASRLRTLAAYYRQAANNLESDRQPHELAAAPMKKLEIDLPLSDSKSIHLARDTDGWRIFESSPIRKSPVVMLRRLADFYERMAETGAYRRLLFSVEFNGDSFNLTASKIGGSGPLAEIQSLPKPIPVINPALFREGLASELTAAGIPKWQATHLANNIAKNQGNLSLLLDQNMTPRMYSLLRESKVAAITGLILAPLDALGQYNSTGRIDAYTVMSNMTLGGASSWAGVYVNDSLLESNLFKSPYVNSLGWGRLSGAAPSLRGLLPSMASGIVATTIFSYGGYFLGYSNLQEAHKNMVAGSIGTVASFGAVDTTLFWVGTYGTASTGTAIASLGGAAASNASFACLGGGSVAAGGYGMLGGTLICTGIGLVVAVAVIPAVYYGFHWWEKRQDKELIRLQLEDLRDRYSKAIPALEAVQN
ncbi:MAG: hypothetical protein PHD76_05500 [Methylacidiphilales bacterium]|nr:hypothetical protein [Candidatus Methylacidiphilales bacterium]